MDVCPCPARDALFLDFDGTLTELVARPEEVAVAPDLPQVLQRLADAFGGALAVVSGRPIADIDAFLRPFSGPAAGVHGAERRDADGRVHRVDVEGLPALVAAARSVAGGDPRLLVEVKSASVALHYRQAPECEAACVQAMEQALAAAPRWVLLHGKMVVEAKPRGVDKGAAVRAFLAEAPFGGRRPWAFGDDVTDEAAFRAVLDAGGMAVKVGAGATLAPRRIADPAALRRWLAAVAWPEGAGTQRTKG